MPVVMSASPPTPDVWLRSAMIRPPGGWPWHGIARRFCDAVTVGPFTSRSRWVPFRALSPEGAGARSRTTRTAALRPTHVEQLDAEAPRGRRARVGQRAAAPPSVKRARCGGAFRRWSFANAARPDRRTMLASEHDEAAN